MLRVKLMFKIKFCTVCFSKYDTNVELGQSVHLYSSTAGVFLFQLFPSAKLPHMAYIFL